MDDAEKKEYMENENCFIGILEDWCSRNEGVELTFFGQPDNLLDKTILDRCPTILLDGRTATATNELTTLMTRNWIAGYAGRGTACGNEQIRRVLRRYAGDGRRGSLGLHAPAGCEDSCRRGL